MAFIGAGDFFAQLSIFRLCWIRGRLGGGKTLLGVAIADEMVKKRLVTGCISNIPMGVPLQPWRDLLDDEGNVIDLTDMTPRERVAARMRGHYRLMRGAVMMYDEAWQELDNRTSMSNKRSYGAFARKFATFWIFPSVLALDKRVSYLSVERVSRVYLPLLADLFKVMTHWRILRKILGPLHWASEEMWKYRWTLELGYMRDTGTFWLMNPSEYFTKYDTKYVPTSDGGISELWNRTVADEKGSDVDEGRWFGTWPEIEDEYQEEVRYLAGLYGMVRALGNRTGGESLE